MPEIQEEAKQDFDSKIEEFFNQVDSESSTEQIEGTEATGETAGAEPEKTEQVKAVEADGSLKVEDKLAKIKEILGDDEKALDAYIKQKGYHNDPAWQKQREQIEKLRKEGQLGGLSVEDKAALDEFKKYRTSEEFIRSSMKTQGFTQEAIDKKLQESGFEVKAKPQDDVNLVIQKLGLKLDDMAPDTQAETKAYISDICKVANVLFEDRFGKILPEKLGPIEQKFGKMEQIESASKLTKQMEETVKKDGILDFNKDIEPLLNKFIDENPDCIQQDIFEHFKQLNHSLTIERLKIGKKKEERDDKRTNLRQNLPTGGGNMPLKKTGSFDNKADDFFAKHNIE